MILPHILKQDLEATVVVRVLNISLAVMHKEGNRFEFSFHQIRISKSIVSSNQNSSKYLSNLEVLELDTIG